MIQFFILELQLWEGGGLHVSNRPNLNCEYRKKEVVQNLGHGVQNIYKIIIQFFTLKLHLGVVGCLSPAPNLNFGYRKKEWCTKFGTWCTKLYKMSTTLWSSFSSWSYSCGRGAACLQPSKFELRISEEGNSTKFGTWCTKYLQNYNPVFYVETAFRTGGCVSPTVQIWIADSGRRKSAQNLGLGVQNCTKSVKNYDPVFYVESAFDWGREAACH